MFQKWVRPGELSAMFVREEVQYVPPATRDAWRQLSSAFDYDFVSDSSRALDGNGIVVDIGRAHEALKGVLAPLNYRNLDEVPEFKGVNTTTEFLTKHIFDRLAAIARAGGLGRDGRELHAIRVTISESHVARASCEAALW